LERQEIKGIYPYYGAMGIVDYINDYLFDGIHLLFSEDGVNVINENGNPSLQYIWGEFWVNNHAHVLKGKGVFTTEILSLALKNTNVSHLVTGAAQPKINQKNMNSIEVLTPTNNILIEIQKLIKPIFENVQIFYEQKSKMQDMLVILLSKLATIKD
jgi:type I restriction enzyme S subunit